MFTNEKHFSPHAPNPERPRYTMTEEMEHAVAEIRATITRLIKFEKRLDEKTEDMLKHISGDNVLFKNTFAEGYRQFLIEVKNEVNTFEEDINSALSLFKSTLEADYEERDEKIRSLAEKIENLPADNISREEIESIVSDYIAENQPSNGENGKDGADGADGVSPIVSVTAIDGGYKINITDVNGSETFTVMNGEDGEKGEKGDNGADGADGKSAYESACSYGYSGTEEQWVASLKGEKGEKGDTGASGAGARVWSTSTTVFLQAEQNVHYVYRYAIAYLSIDSFKAPTDSSIAGVYRLSFKVKDGATIRILPTVYWEGGTAPEFTAGKAYFLEFFRMGHNNPVFAGRYIECDGSQYET